MRYTNRRLLYFTYSFVFRPHGMRGQTVCCLCFCWSRLWSMQKRLNRSRCCLEGWLTWAEGTMYWMGSRSATIRRGGAILGVVRPVEKHWESLLWRISKRDHSVLNNGMTCDATFCNNFLTTRYCLATTCSGFCGRPPTVKHILGLVECTNLKNVYVKY